MRGTLPLVSVIIPVYNNADHIKACIGSVINQTYRNLEVIVVNDGSKDSSPAIINRCQLDDSRILCINQSNAGSNLARKAGLDRAKGKYVQYLDGDDTLFPDAIERLVEKAEATSADIVSAPFVFCHENGSRQCSPILQADELSGIDYFRKIFEWEGATWNMWGNFQKRSLAYEYDIEILADMPYSQDATWMIQLFFHNPKIVTLKTPIINYNQNPQSVSHSRHAASKRYRGTRILYHWFEEFLKDRKQEQDFRKELAIMQSDMTFTCVHALQFDEAREDMKNVIENLSIYPTLIDRLSKMEKVFVRTFKVSDILGYFCLMCYKIRRNMAEAVRSSAHLRSRKVG